MTDLAQRPAPRADVYPVGIKEARDQRASLIEGTMSHPAGWPAWLRRYCGGCRQT